jgi:hypothetical protein
MSVPSIMNGSHGFVTASSPETTAKPQQPASLLLCLFKVCIVNRSTVYPCVYSYHLPCNVAEAVHLMLPPSLQVDLGGTVGEKSWMRGMTEALGWRDAFLDRILMAVILVRHDRHQPINLLINKCARFCSCSYSPSLGDCQCLLQCEATPHNHSWHISCSKLS